MQTRLRILRKRAGLTLEVAAERMGMSTSQVSRIERGESDTTMEKLEQFSHIYSCGVAEVFLESLPMLSTPVIGAVQAGHWTEAIEWPADDQYGVAVPVPDKYKDFKRFALETRGPSMNRRYPEGAILVFVTFFDLDRPPRSGERVLVERRNGNGLVEATCKQYRIDDSGAVWLWPESDHPEHQTPLPLGAADAEEIRVTALVIGSYRQE